MVLGHLGWDYLGNWETWRYISLYSFPNFPNGAGPSALGLFGKLGNWEVCTHNHFQISQVVLGQMGWRLLGNWEIGKYVPVRRPLGGVLETWEVSP